MLAESFHYSPETITLLTGYMPMQNKTFKKKSGQEHFHFTIKIAKIQKEFVVFPGNITRK